MRKHFFISVLSIISILLISSFSGESDLVNNKIETTKVKIAMAQIFCLDGDIAGNFVRIENAIIEAKEKQANIIVFPGFY